MFSRLLTLAVSVVSQCPKGFRCVLTLLLLCLLGGGLFGCSGAPKRPRTGVMPGDTRYMTQRLSYEATRIMEKEQIPSLSISVVDAFGAVYEKAFGLAHVDNGTPATLDTPYRWGSNSKIFVMLALLQLSAQGKINLDAPLRTYLPEFSIMPPPPNFPESAHWKVEDITLRNMLTHHSGLPNDFFGGFLTETPGDFRALLPLLAKQRAQYPANLIHSYSNLAYSLLGILIERVTQTDFNTHMTQAIFSPIGMQNASFVWNEELKTLVARPYDIRGVEQKIYQLTQVPAGSLLATTREMGLFASSLLRGGKDLGKENAFIDSAWLNQSFEQQNQQIPLDFDSQQGLAWFLDSQPDRWGKSARHGGTVLSHFSEFIILPKRQLAVLVVTNSPKGKYVIGYLAHLALDLAIEAKTGETPPEMEQPGRNKQKRKMDQQTLETWPGHYATFYGTISVKKEGDELTAQMLGKRFFLRPLKGGGVGAWVKIMKLFPHRPKSLRGLRLRLLEVNGRKIVVTDGPKGRHFFGVQYQRSTVSPFWKEKTGDYVNVSSKGEHVLIHGLKLALAEDGQLLLFLKVDPAATDAVPGYALRQIDDKTLVTEGLGRNQGLHITVNADNTLSYAGLTFKPIFR